MYFIFIYIYTFKSIDLNDLQIYSVIEILWSGV